MKINDQNIILAVDTWVAKFVIEKNICPFAASEYRQGRIRIEVSHAQKVEELLEKLNSELMLLRKDNSWETTLITVPYFLMEFGEFNDFLDLSDLLIENLGYEGEFQIASFHPEYMFEGTREDSAENYTNRAPYPILQILRESTVEARLAAYPKPEQIPERNIELMNRLGFETLKENLDRIKNGGA